jgi:small subunit ribosomal protein S9
MADEEQQQDERQEQGPEQTPDPEAPQQEGAEEGGDDAERAEDAAAEAPEEPAAAEPGEATAATPDRKPGEELPPGAELDPIQLEDQTELSAEERARLEAEAEERARLEAEITEDRKEEEPEGAPRAPAELAADARYVATGKRKRSIARVIVRPGEGKFEINQRTLEEYFPRPLHRATARQPLAVAGYEGTVDVSVNVQGGGIGGQAGAVRHGVARALTEIDPELRRDLKRRGFLTRDARVKERRKAGLKKARKRPQFSKR